MGDEVSNDKGVRFLNRLIRCGFCQGSSAICLELDRRHVDLLVQQLSMASAKGAETFEMKKSVDVHPCTGHVTVMCDACGVFESGQA